MRVLFWTEMFWPGIGGVEVLASHLLPALAARGHEILVVTDDDHGRLQAHDELHSIRVRRLGMRAALRSLSPGEIASMTTSVEELVRDFSPQLLHLNCLGPTAFFLRRAVTRRVRYCAPPHGLFGLAMSMLAVFDTRHTGSLFVTGDAHFAALRRHVSFTVKVLPST